MKLKPAVAVAICLTASTGVAQSTDERSTSADRDRRPRSEERTGSESEATPAEAGGLPSSAGESLRGTRESDFVRMDREQTRRAQEALEALGYYAAPVDGVHGPLTAQAILDFQRAHGLPATGRLDRATMSALGIDGSVRRVSGSRNEGDRERGGISGSRNEMDRELAEPSESRRPLRRTGAPTSEARAPRDATGVARATSPTASAPRAPRPDPEVRRMQAKLESMGFQPGSIDGILGPRTVAALVAFQRANGLPVTRKLDPRTRARLGLGP